MNGRISENQDLDALLRRISIDDDENAFRNLFEYLYPALCMYAKRFIDDRAAREDIVQDVFLMIWKNRKALPPDTLAKNYLVTSVKNYCLNYLRHQGHTMDYVASFKEKVPVYAEDSNELYLLTELQTLFNKALEKLPVEYRMAFEMSRLEGKSTTEIADMMGISVRTVERYRSKATEIMKNELKDYLPLLFLLLK